MKKRLFSKFTSVLLAVVMTIGMGAVAFGAKQTDEINYNLLFENSGLGLTVELKGNNLDITIQEYNNETKGDLHHIEAKNGVFCKDQHGNIDLIFNKTNDMATIFLNDKNISELLPDNYKIEFGMSFQNEFVEGGILFLLNVNNDEINLPDLSIGWDVERITETPEPQIETLSATFAGVTDSQYGDYEVAVAGSLTGEFQEGDNVLTKEQINAQTMYVVIRNKDNGEVVARKQTSASVKDTTVTVSGGKVTSVTVGGQANTTNGRKDNYTVTMPVN